MFSEILDFDIIHELKDRARMLDIDCAFDYSIDLRGTQWEEKGVYQVEKITEGNKLIFQVDLYFFAIQMRPIPLNMVDIYWYSSIDDTVFEEDIYIAYYNIISKDLAEKHACDTFQYATWWKFSGKQVLRNLYSYIEYDVVIDSGTHYFGMASIDNMTLSMFILQHFRNCEIYSNNLVLHQTEIEKFKAMNNYLHLSGECIIVLDYGSIETKETLIKLLDWVNNKNDIGFKYLSVGFMIKNTEEEALIEWLEETFTRISEQIEIGKLYGLYLLDTDRETDCVWVNGSFVDCGIHLLDESKLSVVGKELFQDYFVVV